jgi:hypothetical protein
MASAGVTAANNWGSSVGTGGTTGHICDDTIYSQCVADNSTHNVWITSTDTDLMEEIPWSMLNYTSVAPPIRMIEVHPSPPDFYQDVEVRAASYPSVQALAWTQCNGPASDPLMTYGGSEANHDRWCKPQVLRYNTFFRTSHFPTDAKQRYIACHELGHTIGLRHTNETSGTCLLKATITPNSVPTVTTTSSHDRAMIAGHYP